MSPDQSSKSIHLPPGTVIHGSDYEYVIEKTLGQGSFGITYLASVKLKGALGELSTKAQVAIKEFCMQGMLSRDGSTLLFGSQYEIASAYLDKFRREAINLSHLHHPGIVRTLESIEENGTAYYVMELIDGTSLGSFVDSRGRLSPEECLTLVRPVAEALDYMHSQSMLHLDVKPGNIMLRRDGRPVLIDFGLSKTFDADGTIDTKTMIGNGTLGYAPIEQSDYSGSAFGAMLPVTMDIYALGATMYKMLTGRRPPEASTVLNEGLHEKELNLCGPLAEVVEKAMNPIIKRRYQSIAELLAELPSTAAAKISIGNSADTETALYGEPTPVINGKEAAVKEAEPTVPPFIEKGEFKWYVLEIKYFQQGKKKCSIRFSDIGNEIQIESTNYQLSKFAIPEDVRLYLGQHFALIDRHRSQRQNEEQFRKASAGIELTIAPDDDVPAIIYQTYRYYSPQNGGRANREVYRNFFDARNLLGLPSIKNLFRTCVMHEPRVVPFSINPNTSRVEIEYQLDLQKTRQLYNPKNTPRHSITVDRNTLKITTDNEEPSIVRISNKQFKEFINGMNSLNADVLPYYMPTLDYERDSWINISLYDVNNRLCRFYHLEEDVEHFLHKFNGGNLSGSVKDVTDYIKSILPQEKKSFWGKIF